MFQDHFGLHDDPFALGPNLRFLFRSNAHAETMAHLGYGLEQGEDIVMISGAIGTGKTIALQNLQAKVSGLFRQVLVNVTTVGYLGFLKLVLHELEVTWPERADVADLLVLLKDAALRCHTKGQKILLVVDEAQNLEAGTLEGVRLLTNIGQPDIQIFQIILAGQLALEEVVNRPELAQLRQRIRIHYRLEPLSREETGEYIAHRLAVAGRDEPLFTPAAVSRIHEISRGIPRLVNHLAGHALLAAFVDRSRKVDLVNVASEGMPQAPDPAPGGVPGAKPTVAPLPDIPAEPLAPVASKPPLRPETPKVPPPVDEPRTGPEPPPTADPAALDDKLPPSRLEAYPARESASGAEERRSLAWVWVTLAVVVFVVGGWYLMRDQGLKRGNLQASRNAPVTRSELVDPAADPGGENDVQPAAVVVAADPIWLHVASFRDQARADRYRDLLAGAGVGVDLHSVVLADGETWLRILVGPYADVAAAEAVGRQLEQQGLITFHRTLKQ